MLNSFLLVTAQELALYKAMKKQGKTAGEAWEIYHEALKLRMERFSRFKRWLLGRIMNSGILIKRMRKPSPYAYLQIPSEDTIPTLKMV